MRILRTFVFVALMLGVGCAVSGTGHAADKYDVAGIRDGAAAERFFHVLQRAVANGRSTQVAAMVSYPITVRIGHHNVKLRHASQLLKHYHSVFNKNVRQALARQSASQLFVNYQGVMIGNGQIWFNLVPGGGRFEITAINN